MAAEIEEDEEFIENLYQLMEDDRRNRLDFINLNCWVIDVCERDFSINL